MRNELIGNVRNMITGFLKNNCMEPSTGRCDNIGEGPARRDRETVLMMHEIAVGCTNVTKPVKFGLQNLTIGRTRARGLRKTSTCSRIFTHRILGSR